MTRVHDLFDWLWANFPRTTVGMAMMLCLLTGAAAFGLYNCCWLQTASTKPGVIVAERVEEMEPSGKDAARGIEVVIVSYPTIEFSDESNQVHQFETFFAEDVDARQVGDETVVVYQVGQPETATEYGLNFWMCPCAMLFFALLISVCIGLKGGGELCIYYINNHGVQ